MLDILEKIVPTLIGSVFTLIGVYIGFYLANKQKKIDLLEKKKNIRSMLFKELKENYQILVENRKTELS